SLLAEVLERVKEEAPSLIYLGMLPGRRLALARYFCKRLRAQFPELKIMVGYWGLAGNREKTSAKLLEAGADQVATTLGESCAQVAAILPVLQYGQETKQLPETAAVS